MLRVERQSARMSKITDDALTRSGQRCFIAVYPYGNSGRQRVKPESVRHLQPIHSKDAMKNLVSFVVL